MKIGCIATDDGPKAVVLHDKKYYDIAEIIGEDLIEAERSFFYSIQKNASKIHRFFAEEEFDNRQTCVPNSYLLPIPYINQIRDFYAFEEHVRNARSKRGLDIPAEWYEFPAYYYSGNSSLYPSDSVIPYPGFTSELDFELEVAAIIGKEGRNIPPGDAWEYVFGFVLMSDWSARDQQRKEMKIGLGPSKSKDFATSFARFFVTTDEFQRRIDEESKINVELWATVNGREYTRNNLNTIHWTFPEMISWASMDVTLKPGDIIMSGTVGNGCILELGHEKFGWLKPGDSVRFGSDVLGTLVGNIG